MFALHYLCYDYCYDSFPSSLVANGHATALPVQPEESYAHTGEYVQMFEEGSTVTGTIALTVVLKSNSTLETPQPYHAHPRMELAKDFTVSNHYKWSK